MLKQKFQTIVLSSLFAAAMLLTAPLRADETKHLVLKDGSYQVVLKYEVKGDRVRYMSAERYEWEEIPQNLIDWTATEQWEKDNKSGLNKANEELSKELEQDEKEDLTTLGPEVAPGLRLPATGGVFVLDSYQGEAQLVELIQTTTDINRDVAGNVLRNVIIPIPSNKQMIELPGVHAKLQAHVSTPAIFINVDTTPAEPDATVKADGKNKKAPPPPPAQPFVLIKTDTKKDNRVVGSVNISIINKVSQKQTVVPTTFEKVTGNWVKLIPTMPLAQGEYVVVEMIDAKEMNLSVWDFGINPSAPANGTAWRPIPAPVETKGSAKPALQGRSK